MVKQHKYRNTYWIVFAIIMYIVTLLWHSLEESLPCLLLEEFAKKEIGPLDQLSDIRYFYSLLTTRVRESSVVILALHIRVWNVLFVFGKVVFIKLYVYMLTDKRKGKSQYAAQIFRWFVKFTHTHCHFCVTGGDGLTSSIYY